MKEIYQPLEYKGKDWNKVGWYRDTKFVNPEFDLFTTKDLPYLHYAFRELME